MVAMAPAVSELLSALAAGPIALDIIATLQNNRSLADRLQTLDPELVVIRLPRDDTNSLIRSVLARVPTAKVLAFSTDGRRALRCCQLLFQEIKLSDPTPQELMTLIGDTTTFAKPRRRGRSGAQKRVGAVTARPRPSR